MAILFVFRTVYLLNVLEVSNKTVKTEFYIFKLSKKADIIWYYLRTLKLAKAPCCACA